MSISQTVITEVRNGSGQVVATDTSALAGDVEQEFSVVAPATGNVVVPIVITAADIVGFAIVSTKAVTLTTNDDGTPDETVELAANTVFAWHAGAGTVNPLPTDLTSIKFANAGGSDADVRGVFLTAAA